MRTAYLSNTVDHKKLDDPISILVKHHVKPDHEKAFLGWNDRLREIMSGFDGFMGQMLFPHEGENPILYHVVFQFSSIAALENWWKSEAYKDARMELSALVCKEPEFKYTNGLEHWFQPPGAQQPFKPPTYKMAVVVYVALMPLIFLVRAFVSPHLAWLPEWEAIMIGTIPSVILMSYVAIPLSVKLFGPWLYPNTR